MTKLVRDKIDFDGGEFREVTCNEEFRGLLGLKLYEEVGEVLAAPDDPAEYADVLEVLEALMEEHGVTLAEVMVEKACRRATRGKFEHGRVLENADGREEEGPA